MLRMRWNGLHLPTGHSGLVLVPGHLRISIGQGNHGDAVIHGANERAKIAPDTFVFFDLGDGLARHAARPKSEAIRIDERDRLMRAILTGDVAEIAADAFVVINFGYP